MFTIAQGSDEDEPSLVRPASTKENTKTSNDDVLLDEEKEWKQFDKKSRVQHWLQ